MSYNLFFSTTLLLYKLDTLLLKQKKLPVLDITGFFFRIVDRQNKKLKKYIYIKKEKKEKKSRSSN